jgi:hypothetical protein
MSENKQVKLFTKRFATLLLTQAKKENSWSKVSGWTTAGGVLASKEYPDRFMADWQEDYESKDK